MTQAADETVDEIWSMLGFCFAQSSFVTILVLVYTPAQSIYTCVIICVVIENKEKVWESRRTGSRQDSGWDLWPMLGFCFAQSRAELQLSRRRQQLISIINERTTFMSVTPPTSTWKSWKFAWHKILLKIFLILWSNVITKIFAFKPTCMSFMKIKGTIKASFFFHIYLHLGQVDQVPIELIRSTWSLLPGQLELLKFSRGSVKTYV